MPHPKVLGFRALYFAVAYMEYFSYFSFIIFKMLKKFFLAAARKIARFPEKNYFSRLWGLQPPTPTPAL